MTDVSVNSWRDFRDRLLTFAKLPTDDRRRWWFRGHSNTAHSLRPTIDRATTFADDADREMQIERRLVEFRREAMIVVGGSELPSGDAFELLARHHGLLSPHLDWTLSPWIASYFAYLNADGAKSPTVAIYALDRTAISTTVLTSAAHANPALEIIDDPELVRLNRRALQQRGVFLRVSTVSQTVENLLGTALSRYILPASDRAEAMADLDEMLLNSTNLMYDLEGAAKTADLRVG